MATLEPPRLRASAGTTRRPISISSLVTDHSEVVVLVGAVRGALDPLHEPLVRYHLACGSAYLREDPMERSATMLAFILHLAPILALAGGPASATPSSLDCRLANQRVEAAIARKVTSLKGLEYCQFRHYDAFDDLDGDGHNDLIALFNVEPASGQNDHNDFMAVFLSSDPPGAEPLIVRTGGRGERDPSAIAVHGHRITLDTQEYLPKDSMCCPSGHGTLVFELAGRTLKRVEPAKKGHAS